MYTPDKKGYTLVIVLTLCALISLSAITLYTSVHLDSLINGNVRRHAHAKHAAASGINHLMSLNIPVPNIVRALREQSVTSGTVLERTNIPGTRSYYRVEASICCNASGGLLPGDTVLVISTGEWAKGDRVISSSSIISTIKWVQ